ncbi:MAG TPA: hypothetical protein VGH48_16245 [Caldimonas sp.]|jgi:hypothetical protein
MFNSETLEVAIGMAFLFLSVSLICTAVKEWLEGVFKWRAMDLERALRTLLADSDGTMTSQLLRHPVLFSLFPGIYDPAQLRSSWLTPGQGSLHMRLSHRRNLPSYIPAGQFAVALLDCVARGPTPADGGDATAADAAVHPGPLSVEALRQSAMALASVHLQRAVLSALDHSAGDLAMARLNVERWFNGTMDRASGWYKRRTQAVLFMLGFAVAAAMNIDALHVMQRLTTDKAFRDVVVKEAATAPAPDESGSAAQAARIGNAKQALERVGLPIGWSAWAPASAPASGAHDGLRALPVPRQLCKTLDLTTCERARWFGADWFAVVCGWFVTAFAVMLGAPFWFDVLNKFMVIRSTVKPHEKSAEAGSEDRQSGEPNPATARGVAS